MKQIITIILAIVAMTVQGQTATSTLIRGRIVNWGHWSRDNEVYFCNPLAINSSPPTVPIQTDSLGRFELEIKLMNTSPVSFFDKELLLSPGETYDVEIDYSSATPIVVKGRNAQLINEIINHPPSQCNWDFDSKEKISDAEMIEVAEKALQRQKAANDSIMKANPGLSQQWRDYAQLVGVGQMSFFLVQRRYVDPMVRQSSDGKLWQWLNDHYVSQWPRPLSLSQSSGYFMWNYVKEILSPRGRKGLNLRGINTAINIALEQQAAGTINRDKDFVQNLKNLQSMLGEYKTLSESGVPDSVLVAHPFAKDVVETFADPYLNGLFKGPVSERETIEDINRLSTLDLPDDLRDYARAVLLYNEIEQFHAPLRPDLQKLASEIKNEFCRQTINERDQFYRDLALHKDIDISLMPNEPLQGITDGKEIFDKIIAPYRGQLVYVDVWGTWCGPCKIDLKYFTKSLHKALDGLPVTYLYLCNGSTMEAWRSTIVDLNLAGEHCVHYNLPADQQNAVEDYLQVRHFPTYIIFDRDGKRVTSPDDEPKASECVKVRRLLDELNH